MGIDSRGSSIHVVASNRAGFRSDALIDAALLAANGTKTVQIKDANGTICTATHVTITNHSGQTAALIITVSRSGELRSGNIDPVSKTVGPEQVAFVSTEVSANPLHILDGETIEIYERVVSIVETNVGTGTQTGLGVRYNATIEPSNRGIS